MKEFEKELKQAREISNKALGNYLKTNKQSDYLFYKQCFEYLRGLLRAKELLIKEK